MNEEMTKTTTESNEKYQDILEMITRNQVAMHDELKMIRKRMGVMVFFFILLPILAFIFTGCGLLF